ncbi:peptidoglycan-binding protein [Janibacter melonis]|uniref:peptidoglycan-binding domain-containing protein n=1 Tax=Janibacter melonis TaxID=262209 RepID=UPI002043064D|nr:peptidoglycan-binding protein [Janibacter melonis]MCM3554228.1 peptidoglycan-binding protein [Janibacter melonis]
MSLSARVLGALVVPAVTIPVMAPLAAADAPRPPVNNNLPGDLDVASPYLPQTVCDPVAKPGVTAFARLMSQHYSQLNYGISRNCNAGLTEHSEGRALDWMLNKNDPRQREIADSVVAWLVAPDAQGRPGAMARRFGVMYIIWDRKIWGTYNMGVGWRPYYGSSPHTDHIHFSFSWDGAMQRTSWWTGKAWTSVTSTPGGSSGTPVTPPVATPDSYPTLKIGAKGDDVKLAQKVIGVTADGAFGPATQTALRRWQSAQSIPVTGVLDTRTWERMVALGEIPARGGMESLAKYFKTTLRLGSTGEAVKAAQKKLGITADGSYGEKTATAVRSFQRKMTLKVDGVIGENAWRALAGLPYKKNGSTQTPKPTPVTPTVRSTTEYSGLKSTVLAPGARGAAVKTLQRALAIGVDGSYGSATEKAVRSFQWASKLKVTGVVDAKTWDALEARDYPFLKYRTTVIKPGSKGYAVTTLQRYLGVRADGSYGPKTVEAVKALQGRRGMARTGIVGGMTWQALEHELRARRAG